MTPGEMVMDRERCRRSCHYFLFSEHGGQRVVTKDEHDTESPVKPVPDLPYLRVLVDGLLVAGRMQKPEEAAYGLEHGLTLEWLQSLAASGIMMVEKSRQMFVTWCVVSYLLWRAKYHAHQLIMIQSKREEDAANLVFTKDPHVARMSFLESHLPRHLKTVEFPKGGTFGHLYFPNGSHVWGIPEGAQLIRSNTPSVIFSDESAFQPEFGASYTAALPAVKGGGSYIGVSSAEPGTFMELVGAA